MRSHAYCCAIVRHFESQNPFRGKIEIDESYFGPRRVRGKRGRGAQNHRLRRVQAGRSRLHPDRVRRDKNTLCKAIRGRIDLDSIIHSDV